MSLTFGGEKTGKRGHFSRLFTNSEWASHKEAMASGAQLLYSSSSSSSTFSSDTEECESEDSLPSENDAKKVSRSGVPARMAAPPMSKLVVQEEDAMQIYTDDSKKTSRWRVVDEEESMESDTDEANKVSRLRGAAGMAAPSMSKMVVQEKDSMQSGTNVPHKASRLRGTAGKAAPNVKNLIFAEEDPIDMEAVDPARQAASVGDLIFSEGENSDSEAFSDISDNSDIFHVATDDSAAPRTPEDVDLALIDSIAAHLRDYTLLPPDVRDPQGEQSFKDVSSGIRFPLVHCGFKGCSWQYSKKWCKDASNASNKNNVSIFTICSKGLVGQQVGKV